MCVYVCVQTSKASEKTPSKTLDPEVYEKKIRLLEKQRRDVSVVQMCFFSPPSFFFSFFFDCTVRVCDVR